MGAVRRSLSILENRTRAILGICLIFATVKLAVQVFGNVRAQSAGYGIFRDELYLLVCGRHLGWGYVDQPFMAPLQARISEWLFGYHHLWALRLLSALAGAAKVFLTGVIAAALGGDRKAAALSMLGVLAAGIYLGIDGYLSMNSFEPVFWMTCVLALIQIVRTDPAQPATNWWIVFGISAGLGFENKVSIAFFLVCLLVGVLFSPQRKILRSRGFGLAIAVALLLILPNLLWQAQHSFPTLEWLQEVQKSGKDVKLSPPRFLLAQLIMLSPLNVLLWGTGLGWLLFGKAARPFRFLGIAWLLFLVWMMAVHAKDYYLAPAYPVLFAAGGVCFRNWYATRRWRSAVVVLFAVLLVAGMVVFLPFSIPVLPPAQYLAYARSLHFQPADTEVESEKPPLPQFYADRFGWQELADQVSRIYNSLPADERRRTGIFASNYGEASAIAILASGSNLPPPISGHQNFWIWGPRGFTGQEMIVVAGATLDEMHQVYGSCVIAGRMDNPYSMPYEHRPIFLCHDRKLSYQADWPTQKHYR